MSESEKSEEATLSDLRVEVPIECPARVEEMLRNFFAHQGEVVGWCLLCNSPLRTEDDFIPETNTHNCERGRAIHASSAEQRVDDATEEDIDKPAEFLRDLALGRRCRVRHRFR